MKWINLILALACLAVITGSVAPQYVPGFDRLIGKTVTAGADARDRWTEIVELLKGPETPAPELVRRQPMRVSGAAGLSNDVKAAAERRWHEMLAEARLAGPGRAENATAAKAATERAKQASAAARANRSASRAGSGGESSSIFERSSQYQKHGSAYDRSQRRTGSNSRVAGRTRR